jgi:hypothetical protein
MTASAYQRLTEKWRSSGIAIRPGVSLNQISEFEQKLGLRLPNEFADYYLTVDGMPEHVSDEHGIRLWQFRELQRVDVALPGLTPIVYDGFYVFADYSMWTHGYAIQLSRSRTSEVALVGSHQPIPIASSFSEFLHHYLEQPDLLFPETS